MVQYYYYYATVTTSVDMGMVLRGGLWKLLVVWAWRWRGSGCRVRSRMANKRQQIPQQPKRLAGNTGCCFQPSSSRSTNMSSSSAPYPPAFEAYNSDYAKQQGLDFFSFQSPSDILAPHPDLFESELDSSLAGFDEVQLQLLTVDSNDAYSFLRSDTPTCGPPSTITVSSESAYDSLSSHSESFYNYPHSPYAATNYSFPIELEMDFRNISVGSDYGAAHPNVNPLEALEVSSDPTSFGTLPPTPPRSPQVSQHHQNQQRQQHHNHHHHTHSKSYDHRTSYSDYGPPTRNTSSSDYYSQLSYNAAAMAQSTVSPTHVNTQLPMVPSIPLPRAPVDDSYRGDPRKKYKCSACPRGKHSPQSSFFRRY